jgi:hypothetical protein
MPGNLQVGEEGWMNNTQKHKTWVVYWMTVHGKPGGASAVCEQEEWDAMERSRPGYHTLVLAGIPTEGEAEQRARQAQLDTQPSKPSRLKVL